MCEKFNTQVFSNFVNKYSSKWLNREQLKEALTEEFGSAHDPFISALIHAGIVFAKPKTGRAKAYYIKDQEIVNSMVDKFYEHKLGKSSKNRSIPSNVLKEMIHSYTQEELISELVARNPKIQITLNLVLYEKDYSNFNNHGCIISNIAYKSLYVWYYGPFRRLNVCNLLFNNLPYGLQS